VDGRRAAELLPEALRSPTVEQELGEKMRRERRRAFAEQLVEFSKQTPQQRNAMYHLASLHMPTAALPRTALWFRRLDADLSGHIDLHDMADELMEHASLDAATAMRISKVLDVNQTGAIEFRDLLAAVATLDRESVIEAAPWISSALEADWERCLDFKGAQLVLAEAVGGRLQEAEVQTWIEMANAKMDEIEDRVPVTASTRVADVLAQYRSGIDMATAKVDEIESLVPDTAAEVDGIDDRVPLTASTRVAVILAQCSRLGVSNWRCNSVVPKATSRNRLLLTSFVCYYGLIIVLLLAGVKQPQRPLHLQHRRSRRSQGVRPH
jgi:Ca2+-binding EF-hand superfamily protein